MRYLEEWLEKCLKHMTLELKPTTVKNYRSRLSKWVSPIWKGLRINEITKQDVFDMVIGKYSEPGSDYSRRSLLKMIKRILEMAIEHDLIDRNPANGIKIKVAEKEQKVLTSEESYLLLKEAKICNHPFYEIWLMALFTGMRSSELIGIEWSDIDLEAGHIHVTKQWSAKYGFRPTKTYQNRIVPISKDLMAFLKEKHLRRSQDGFLLPRLKEWLNAEQSKVLKSFCMAIGITPIRFHDLRATFITNLLSMGVSLARVMAIVGHGDIKTTNVYLRQAGVDLKGATESLSYKIPTQKEAKIISIDF